ncbi:MAG: rhomboid family intramembrane serine protease [Candidatus Woesearchaeota archaeon]
MKKQISSETEFIFTIIPQLLSIPYIFVMALFGKRKISEILLPLKSFFRYVTEPTVTWYLIAINVFIFFIGIFIFFHNEAFVSQLINYPSDLFTLRWHTFITAGFIHASVLHLLGNMLALFIFGRIVEREYGSKGMLFIYTGSLLFSGVFSALVHIYLGENPGGVGASGAIMGIVATAMLIRPFYLTYYTIFPLPIMFYGWMYLLADISGVLSQADSGIGHLAHLGGFLSVGFVVYYFMPKERARMKLGLLINVVSALLLWIIFARYFSVMIF